MDAIYDWTNHLDATPRSYFEKIASKINSHLEEGFTIPQAVDLLIGEGEKLSDVERVAQYILSQAEDENIVVASGNKIPTRYSDIKDTVEELVKDLSPKDFASAFASKNSLMCLSDKKYENFEKLVWFAKKHPENINFMEEIHDKLQPYVDQAIQDSQLLAQEASNTNNFKFKQASKDIYKVKDGKNAYQVNLENKTCTCNKYILCSYNLLKIPCEHILEASKKFSSNFSEDMIGEKVVFAQRTGANSRYAWCDKENNEIMIENSCIKSNCPFLKKDNDETITCSFC